MLIATFGPTCGWDGRRITFENGKFTLEDHGFIAAADVMEYDRLGHVAWPDGGTRAWVGARALAEQKSARRKKVPAASPPERQAAAPEATGSADAAPEATVSTDAAREATVSTDEATEAASGETPEVVIPLSAKPPWWKRPNVIIPLIAGVALVTVLLVVGLSMLSTKLTPQEIYQKRVGSVVQIQTDFPGTYDAYGAQAGGGQALGTGFVVSRDGYILTNAHVVSESGQAVDTVTVVFNRRGSQGAKVEGKVVSADESTDVALIKVDPAQTPRLVPIPLGDSSRANVGEPVVAIGNPFGLDSSLSLRVVSATHRDLESPNGATIRGGIQTDAAINPGNSGGPLINAKGQVIGINEQIATASGGNEGIGFAVPINVAVRVMRQMIEADAQSQ